MKIIQHLILNPNQISKSISFDLARRAIISVQETISKIRSSGSNAPSRIYIDYLLPLPPQTSDADIDPWPGGETLDIVISNYIAYQY